MAEAMWAASSWRVAGPWVEGRVMGVMFEVGIEWGVEVRSLVTPS